MFRLLSYALLQSIVVILASHAQGLGSAASRRSDGRDGFCNGARDRNEPFTSFATFDCLGRIMRAGSSRRARSFF
jgi:hypothetical protein